MSASTLRTLYKFNMFRNNLNTDSNNVLLVIIMQLLILYLDHMLGTSEDDTKSLIEIIKVSVISDCQNLKFKFF